MNKLTKTAREILMIEEDLPFRLDYSSKPYPTVDDFDMFMFEQAWADTSLGFGGIGGQAITFATTYVFVPASCDQKCFVYFAGRFAYAADYNKAFIEDLKTHRMASVAMSGKYRKENE